MAALFIIAKVWKQPKCPLLGDWINKLWPTQAVEWYSELKRDEKTWRNLKCISLSERSPSEKATSCKVPPVWHSDPGKSTETAKGSGVGGKGGAAKGPEWAWMVGWEIGFREQGAGWGAVRRLGGNLRPRENVGAKKGSQRCQES